MQRRSFFKRATFRRFLVLARATMGAGARRRTAIRVHRACGSRPTCFARPCAHRQDRRRFRALVRRLQARRRNRFRLRASAHADDRPNPSAQVRASRLRAARISDHAAKRWKKRSKLPRSTAFRRGPTASMLPPICWRIFMGRAEGEDFLYDAAIRRDDCRGLDTSGKRPASLS